MMSVGEPCGESLVSVQRMKRGCLEWSFPGPRSWKLSDGLGRLGLIHVSHLQAEGALLMLCLVCEQQKPGWSQHDLLWKGMGC